MEFANKTQMGFEPVLSLPVAIDEAGDKYETPVVHREKLGDLARLSYLQGEMRYTIRLNQATGVGSGVIKITDGVNTIAEAPVDFSAGEELHGKINADLFTVNGGAQLRAVLSVDAAAASGTTAEVKVVLDVEHPVVIGTC